LPFQLDDIQLTLIHKSNIPDFYALLFFTASGFTFITRHTHTDVLFIIGNWNAKVGSQEIPGITGKFILRVQNEAGQRLTEFC